jgi:hypothetical protein
MSSIIGLVVFVFATAWSLAANATIVKGGFSGEIFSGFDFGSAPGGFFGAGTDLDGQPITGTFTYDTAKVPPPQTSGLETIYRDPAFATDFLDFTVTVNGRTYAFGEFPTLPGIQSISVIDNTDQLQYDFERFAVADNEAITLRLLSDLDFLTGTGVPTHFDFVASGVGLFPGGSFNFDRANGDSAFASFSIDTAFARAVVPEPGTLGIVAFGLFGLAGLRRRHGS